MPAWQLTANSIWTSFRSSAKRHIVLTGSLGSGKTTLLSKLFPSIMPGITSWAEPHKSVFMRDNLTGEFVKVADYDDSIQGTKLKMVLLGDVMKEFGCSVISRCLQNESGWVTIDEIGFLEEKCTEYQDSIRNLFERKQVAAVVRKQDLPFLNELKSREDVFLVDMDEPYSNCGCVIMASGLGKRFGENKLMADFLGEPLITRILNITDGLFAKRVVVTRHEDVAKLCKERDIPFVLHSLPHRSDTVRLGLEAVGEVENCMFCPCDQPLLSRDTVLFLLLCGANSQEKIWRPCCKDTPGSPVLFPCWAFPELMNLPEGKGGGVVMKKHPEKVAYVEIENPLELVDADTPETLEMLKGKAL